MELQPGGEATPGWLVERAVEEDMRRILHTGLPSGKAHLAGAATNRECMLYIARNGCRSQSKSEENPC